MNDEQKKTRTKGKMIVVYGINGIGKTTQVELLVKYLQEQGHAASRLKYPVYDLEPEGPFIYKYLRDPKFRAAHPKTTAELQLLYVENRRRYEPELRERLDEGEWIIAEDYIGTGIAWGLTWGSDLDYLEKINEGLLQPDMSILMTGERFTSALEKDHRNEMDDERMRICKNFHTLLGQRYGWKVIHANDTLEVVQMQLRTIVNN